jgi:hypothetical protein
MSSIIVSPGRPTTTEVYEGYSDDISRDGGRLHRQQTSLVTKDYNVSVEVDDRNLAACDRFIYNGVYSSIVTDGSLPPLLCGAYNFRDYVLKTRLCTRIANTAR